MKYHSCYTCYSCIDRQLPNQLLDGVIHFTHVILVRVTRQTVTKPVAGWSIIHVIHAIRLKTESYQTRCWMELFMLFLKGLPGRKLPNRLLDGIFILFMSFL